MHARPLLALALLLLLSGCAAAAPAGQAGQISVTEALRSSNAAGFAKATSPREFSFPQDHGPHQEYATEWWYYTGNLSSSAGRQFGFQLTFFRIGLTPKPVQRASDWGAANIYMAHFALSDIDGRQFFAFDRFSRDAAGLAGAQADPFRVWLEGWRAEGPAGAALPMRLQAAQGDAAIDLTLDAGKPPVLQGDRGLSQKSAEPGNASYYYSLTRMPTSGSVRVAGETFAVTGQSWMDREWSTSLLADGVAGWDWFALQLADGRDLMYFQLRDRAGGADAYSSGALIDAAGASIALHRDDTQLEPIGSWQSPHTGARYPAGWRLRVPSQGLDLTITPALADQELVLATIYWEGAVTISGTAGGQPAAGRGYVELTGYVERGEPDEVRVR